MQDFIKENSEVSIEPKKQELREAGEKNAQSENSKFVLLTIHYSHQTYDKIAGWVVTIGKMKISHKI
jgi:hypothetical protein